jgi:coenzyme F420-dependent glucose-6-phosphate dehydrogenase
MDSGLGSGRGSAQIKPYLDAGLNHLVFHGPGHDQRRFLEQLSEDIAPRLRALAT